MSVAGSNAMSDLDTSQAVSWGWLGRLLRQPKNSLAKTLLVPAVVSLVCAILVSGAVIALRPQQQLNEERNRQQNILSAAGLLQSGVDLSVLFEQFEPRVIDLASGAYAADLKPSDVERQMAGGNPASRVVVPREQDIAVIKTRSRYAVGYFLLDNERLKMIILPVYGYGLWSTLYGYIALEADADTIVGLRFYRHGETPGLGGEIDNPRWLQQWRGKRIFNDSGEPEIEVLKGAGIVSASGRSVYQVDGITGATLTGRGVTNLLRYWMGPHGFGPFLRSLRDQVRETL